MEPSSDLCETPLCETGCGFKAIPDSWWLLCQWCLDADVERKKRLKAEEAAKERLAAAAADARQWIANAAAAAKQQLDNEAAAKKREVDAAAANAAHVLGVILKQPIECLELPLPLNCGDDSCFFCDNDGLEPSGDYVSFHEDCGQCVKCGGIYPVERLFMFAPDFKKGITRTIVPFVRDDDNNYCFCSEKCADSQESIEAFEYLYKPATPLDTPLASGSDTE